MGPISTSHVAPKPEIDLNKNSKVNKNTYINASNETNEMTEDANI